jgi:endoglucanase
MAGLNSTSETSQPDAFYWNALIGKGINLGNALEAPKEREEIVRLEERHFDLIADAGFDSVRIPIRWSAYAEAEAPYTIDPAFLSRVDWAVDQVLSHGLVAIINVHHYKEFMESPAEHRDRLLGMWKQISEHYSDYPAKLYFEIMNEPHRNVTAGLWNEVQNEAIALIRKSNPDRAVLVSPIGWNRIDQLENLKLPLEDGNLIASVHYYEPHGFTHQGASWVEHPIPVGVSWDGSDAERQAVVDDFEVAAAWSATNRIPIHMGEFGAYSKADMESRARWTTFVRGQAEKQGMSWNYWEFCSSFGVYDPDTRKWRAELLDALLPGNGIEDSRKMVSEGKDAGSLEN